MLTVLAKIAVVQAVMLAVLLAVLLVRWSVNVLEAAPPRGYTRRASGRARCADCGVPPRSALPPRGCSRRRVGGGKDAGKSL